MECFQRSKKVKDKKNKWQLPKTGKSQKIKGHSKYELGQEYIVPSKWLNMTLLQRIHTGLLAGVFLFLSTTRYNNSFCELFSQMYF